MGISTKLQKTAIKKLRRNRGKVALLTIFVLVLVVGKVQAPEPRKIHPSAYGPLLETIAKGESKGNYNAYYGHATNKKIRFTQMSVAEVITWQKKYVQKGSVSSAVGKYQIVRPTLEGLVQQLDIDTSLPFDPDMQDRMAIALLERRGSEAFANNKITREQFAANLAKEWAALPKVKGANPSESHYQGDGINKSRVSITEVFAALANLEG